MAKNKKQYKPIDTSNVDTDIFIKGMIKDSHKSFVGKENWTHAINAINNSARGDAGTIGNEPANLNCINSKLPIIGFIHLYSDKWIVFSTDDYYSEIGLFDDSQCKYDVLIFDLCLNFKRKYLITGASKENYDCSWQIYWDDGLNPSRTLNIGPPDRFTENINVPWKEIEVSGPDSTGTPCVENIDINVVGGAGKKLNCDLIRLAPLMKTPCVELSKSKGPGQLANGSYQVYIAYTINEQQIGDYIGVSNVQPLYDHQGSSCSLDVKITNLDKNFDYYKLVILMNNQQQTQAIQIGFYSTHQEFVNIDYILENKATSAQVPLQNLPLQNPAYERSDKMVPVNDYLLRIGPTTNFDFNYQCQANKITAKWVSVQYPAEYYKNGGNKPTFMRDEQYAFFIRFIYQTGEKSSSYHIPGREPMLNNDFYGNETSTSNTDGNNTLFVDETQPWQVKNTAYADEYDGVTTLDDGGVILSKGQMGYWESTELYPIEDPDDRWCELCGTPIRHHKFPDEQSETDGTTDRSSPDNQHIRVLGVEFDNITWPVDLEGNIITNIVGYEILVGSREGNKSILSKGLVRNMKQYPLVEGGTGSGQGADNPLISGTSVGLYPNYPFNDLNDDVYLTNSPPETGSDDPMGSNTIGEYGYCGYSEGFQADYPVSFGCNNFYTFHSPETSFQQPFLNAAEVKSYGFTSGYAQGYFKPSEGHPKNVLIRDFAAILAGIIGCGYALSQMRGKRKTKVEKYAQVPNLVVPPASATGFQLTAQGYETLLTATSAGIPTVFPTVPVPVTAAGPGLGEFAYMEGTANLLDIAAAGNSLINAGGGLLAGNQAIEFEGTDVKSLPNILSVLSSIFMTMHYASVGGQEVVDLVYNIAGPTQHAWKYNSYGLYATTQKFDEGDIYRQRLTKARYVGDTMQDFGSDDVGMNIRINNLFRPKTVAVQTSGTLGGVGNGLTMPLGATYDSSRQTMGSQGIIDRPTSAIRSAIGAHYVALKFAMANQYGQLDGIKQIPIPCRQEFRLSDGSIPPAIEPDVEGFFPEDIDPTVVTSENYTEGDIFKSGILFGGDTYISRYSEKVIMPFFWEFLNGQEDGFGFDYRQYQNIGFARYYMDTNKYNMAALFAPIASFEFDWSVGNALPTSMRNMDRSNTFGGGANSWSIAPSGLQLSALGDDISNSIFVLKKAYMYTHCSGVNDFFVESDLNIALRSQGNSNEQMHYDWSEFTDINSLFHADIIRKGNFYKYDFSLSKSNLVSQMITYGMIQPRDYDPEVADTCYDHYTKRIIYSNQAHKEAKKDFWRVYLPNNYQDFKNVPTTVKPISKSGAMILFPHLSPQLFQGVDTLTTDFNTKLTIGDGGLFNEPMQQISTADLPHEYGSSENAPSIINTPAGIYFMSQAQGKIFNYAQQLENIADAGMKQWFNTYLPSRLIQKYPELEGTKFADNTVVGIGCQAVYDPNYDIVYFAKKDYEPCDGNDCLQYDGEGEQWYYNQTVCGGIPGEVGCPPGTELICQSGGESTGDYTDCQCCDECPDGWVPNGEGECCTIEYGEIDSDLDNPIIFMPPPPGTDDEVECIPGCLDPDDPYYGFLPDADQATCHDPTLCKFWTYGDPYDVVWPYQGLTISEAAEWLGLPLCSDDPNCAEVIDPIWWKSRNPINTIKKLKATNDDLTFDSFKTVYLKIHQTLFDTVYKGNRGDIDINLPFIDNEIVKLNLEYINIEATDYKAVRVSEKGRVDSDSRPKVRSYRVSGKQKNKKGKLETYGGTISFFAHGKLVGLILKDGKPYEIKNIKGNKYALYDVNNARNKPRFKCDTEDLIHNQAELRQRLQKSQSRMAPGDEILVTDGLQACIGMCVDVDYYTYSSDTFNSNFEDVEAWVLALIANVNYIYTIDLNVSVTLIQLQVFEDEASDPYSSLQFVPNTPEEEGGMPNELQVQLTCDGLNLMESYWNDPANGLVGFVRSVVNLWTFKIESRGKAWGIGGLCVHQATSPYPCATGGGPAEATAYAICGMGASEDNVGDPTNPWVSITQSWALKVVSHELGHNIGASHTSQCVWSPEPEIGYEGNGLGGNGRLDNCADEQYGWIAQNEDGTPDTCIINNPAYTPGDPFFPVTAYPADDPEDPPFVIDYYTIMSQGTCQDIGGGMRFLFNPVVKRQRLVPHLELRWEEGCLECDFDVPNPLSFGCTDPFATNYNPDAEFDNGSCFYPYCDCEYGYELYIAGTDILATTSECLNPEIQVECRKLSCEDIACQDVTVTDVIEPIEFGDPNYFTDISWTASYDPKIKGWISFHDWHPELSVSSHNHFLTTKTQPHPEPLCPPGYTWNPTGGEDGEGICEYYQETDLEPLIEVDHYPCCPITLNPIDIYISLDTSGSTGTTPDGSWNYLAPDSIMQAQMQFVNGLIALLTPFMNLGLVQVGVGKWSSSTVAASNRTLGNPGLWFNNTPYVYDAATDLNWSGGATNMGNGIGLLNSAKAQRANSSLGDRSGEEGYKYFAIIMTDGDNWPGCAGTSGCSVIDDNPGYVNDGTGCVAGCTDSTILWAIRSNPWGDCFPDLGDIYGGTPTCGGWNQNFLTANDSFYNWTHPGCGSQVITQQRILELACEVPANFGSPDFRSFAFGPDASVGFPGNCGEQCTLEEGFMDQIIAQMIPPCECECEEGYVQIGETNILAQDENGDYYLNPLYPPYCVKLECDCPPASDVNTTFYPDNSEITWQGIVGECPDAALWGYGNIYGLDADGNPYTFVEPDPMFQCLYDVNSTGPPITDGGGIWKHNVRCDLFNNYYNVQYPWEIELIESIGQTVNTIRSVEYQLESYEYKPKYDSNGCMINYGCDDRWHDLMYNFDEAIIYNSEQVSGLLSLTQQTPDVNDIMSYPIIGANDIQILYRKVEQKYRFDQFWDITADRNLSEPIFITRLNGYIKDLNTSYMNYNKPELERKKFRHYTNSLVLRKRVEYIANVIPEGGISDPVPCDCPDSGVIEIVGDDWIALEDCICGCMDVNAENYNPLATNNDGSCVYSESSEIPILHTRKMILKLVNTKINLSIR
jgi:hypothetical protein